MEQTQPEVNTKPEVEAIKAYPYYKIILWRYARAFVWGAVSTLSSLNIALNADLSNWKVWVFAGIAGIINGGLQTLGKIIRDEVSQGNQNHPIEKLPI